VEKDANACPAGSQSHEVALTRRGLVRSAAFLIAFLPTLATPAWGQTCDASNLLAGRPVHSWVATYRPELATDGVLGHEGDPSNGSLSTMLGPGAAMVWDLGGASAIGALLVQASADAQLVVEGSDDGVSFRTLWQSNSVGAAADGLRARMAWGLDGQGRYLRLRPLPGQGPVAISEFQAFCHKPPMLDVEIRSAVVAPPPADLVKWQAWRKIVLGVLAILAFCLSLLTDKRRWLGAACGVAAGALAVHFTFGAAGTLCLGAFALAATALAWRQTRRGLLAPQILVTALALTPMLLAGPLAFTNFGRWAGYRSVHYHDNAHYFLGAKYAAELGYTRLYDCVAKAAQEENRWPTLAPQTVRDLRSNAVVPLQNALDQGQDCASRFTATRWADFRRDVVFFQSQLHPTAWAALLTDHGYNATPIWTFLLRTLILRDRPASAAWLETLSHLDDIGSGLIVIVLVWGFGLRAGTLAVLIIGLGFPWITLWTGGGIGRSLWLLCALAGFAAGQRGRDRTAGAFLGVATGLQIFPALFLSGAVLARLANRQGDRMPDLPRRPLLLAFAVTCIGLATLSLQVAGPGLWLDFARNGLKHMASTSSNRIGLAQIVAVLHGPSSLTWLLALALLAFWVKVELRIREEPRRTTLALALPLFVFNLSSYYLAVLAGAAPRLKSPARITLALLILVIIPQALALFTAGVPGPAYYAAVSLLIVAATTTFLAAEARS
jgi:hypothetical protein